MPNLRVFVRLITCAAIVAPISAQARPPVAAPLQGQTPPAASAGAQVAATQQPPSAAARRGPKPYDQVITADAQTERGALVVHKVDDKHFFEIPDAMLGRDWLLVSRLSGVPAGSGGFQSAGSSLNERMVRWERLNNNILLKSISVDAVADPSLPIARSVRQNNFAPILASFPIAALGPSNDSAVIDVTTFFGGDTPALQAEDFLRTVLNAIEIRTTDQQRWQEVCNTAQSERFGWDVAAKAYQQELYAGVA